ncbi:13795_t:CDS:2, partial [Cetraspora pellucida]
EKEHIAQFCILEKKYGEPKKKRWPMDNDQRVNYCNYKYNDNKVYMTNKKKQTIQLDTANKRPRLQPEVKAYEVEQVMAVQEIEKKKGTISQALHQLFVALVPKEIQVLQKIQESQLFLKHNGRRIKVHISNNRTKKLEVPEKKDEPGSDSRDEFGKYIYEDEELVKAEEYFTEEAIKEPIDLFYNPSEELTSLALYLTNIEEMLIKNNDETEIIVERQIEQFLQNDTLNKEDKEKAASFFEQKRDLFTSDMQELEKMNMITHHIKTANAKQIKRELQQQQAFETLKIHLITAPILKYPDFNDIFFLYTDVFGIELEAIFAQKNVNEKEHVILYASCNLSKAEQNYSACELECLAVI